MKKILLLIIILLSFDVYASTVKAGDDSPYSYDKIKNAVKEVMRDYYIRQSNIQYHNSRRENFSPEEATSQDIKYTVCSGFAYNVYNEAFGTQISKTTEAHIETASQFEDGEMEISLAKTLYGNIKNNKSKNNGNFLIYYEKTASNIVYSNHNKTNYLDFVKSLQPGDIIAYSGHTMMVYDIVERADGVVDALILNSTFNKGGTSEIFSRFQGTRSLSYISSKPTKNNIIDVDREGSIRYLWLSSGSNFLNSNTVILLHDYISGCKINQATEKCTTLKEKIIQSKIACQKEECAVIRPFYKATSGKAVFNYDMLTNQYKKTMVRVKYPGLVIEKTVNKGDNNSVYPNSILTYNIKITNKSDTTYNGKKYGAFIVKEKIDSSVVSYVSSTNNGSPSGNEVIWNIDGLNANKTITLQYTVMVKNNPNKEIVSEGGFYGPENSNFISTGVIKNTIIPKATGQVKSYEECYKEVTDFNEEQRAADRQSRVPKPLYVGLELIDKVYECAWNKDYKFGDFKFEELFDRKATETDQIYFKKNVTDLRILTYKKMILNNYWGGTTVYKNNGYKFATLKWVDGSNAGKRKRSFNNIDFRDGDVLIYQINYDGLINPYNNNSLLATAASKRHTKENGIYAFVYINGKFVTDSYFYENRRTEFTYKYYKDTYGNYTSHFYEGYDNIKNDSNAEEILTNIHFNTLLDKDYYIILRPEIVIASGSSIGGSSTGIGTSKSITTTYKKGDVNGDGKVGTADALLIRKHLLNLSKLTGDELKRADVNGDGKVSTADSNAIRKIMLGL